MTQHFKFVSWSWILLMEDVIIDRIMAWLSLIHRLRAAAISTSWPYAANRPVAIHGRTELYLYVYYAQSPCRRARMNKKDLETDDRA
jgi:hypothetical protein